ncbi:MAG: crossover junction endodeoxyribonuclease RuvC, partial [Phenylobacterium sp.]
MVRLGAPAAAIASAVATPAGYRTLYVSGQTPAPLKPGAPGEFGDTKTQTLSVLGKIRDILVSQGMDMGDVVMMRVYLVGDPAKGGQMDFAGMMEAYKTFFGTAEQPNKPARVTVESVFSQARFARAAIVMGHARGVVVLAAMQQGIEVSELAP